MFKNLFSFRKLKSKSDKKISNEEWIKIAIEEKEKLKYQIQKALEDYSKIKGYQGIYDVWIFPNREVDCILRSIPQSGDNFSMYQLGNDGKLFCSFPPLTLMKYNPEQFNLWFEEMLDIFIDRLEF